MHQRTASDHTGAKWRGTCIYRPGGASQSLKQSQGTLCIYISPCVHASLLQLALAIYCSYRYVSESIACRALSEALQYVQPIQKRNDTSRVSLVDSWLDCPLNSPRKLRACAFSRTYDIPPPLFIIIIITSAMQDIVGRA